MIDQLPEIAAAFARHGFTVERGSNGLDHLVLTSPDGEISEYLFVTEEGAPFAWDAAVTVGTINNVEETESYDDTGITFRAVLEVLDRPDPQYALVSLLIANRDA